MNETKRTIVKKTRNKGDDKVKSVERKCNGSSYRVRIIYHIGKVNIENNKSNQ